MIDPINPGGRFVQTLFYDDKPIPFVDINKDLPDYRGACFVNEFYAIERAVDQWLKPIKDDQATGKYLLPSQRYCSGIVNFGGIDSGWLIPRLILQQPRNIGDLTLILSIYEAASYRSKDLHSELIAVHSAVKVLKGTFFKSVAKKSVQSKLFSSRQGLLPLVWAEIMFAVEHDIYAGICEICSSVFAYNQRYNQKVCGDECRKTKAKTKLDEMDPEIKKIHQNLRQAKSRAKTKDEKKQLQKEIDQLLNKGK